MCNCNNSSNINIGNDGFNAYTLTTSSYTQPSVNTNVTINVSNNGQYTGKWAVPGQIIYIDNGGYYTVVSSTATTIIIKYESEYATINQSLTAVASPIASNSRVSPAGLKGETGNSGPSVYFNVIPYFGSNTDYKTVTSATYVSASQILFPGTSNLASGLALTEIKANCWMLNSGASGDILIYDITNNNNIASITGVTSNTTSNISTLTIINSNLSTNNAVWEVRMLGTLSSSPSEFAISSLMLKYS